MRVPYLSRWSDARSWARRSSSDLIHTIMHLGSSCREPPAPLLRPSRLGFGPGPTSSSSPTTSPIEKKISTQPFEIVTPAQSTRGPSPGRPSEAPKALPTTTSLTHGVDGRRRIAKVISTSAATTTTTTTTAEIVGQLSPVHRSSGRGTSIVADIVRQRLLFRLHR